MQGLESVGALELTQFEALEIGRLDHHAHACRGEAAVGRSLETAALDAHQTGSTHAFVNTPEQITNRELIRKRENATVVRIGSLPLETFCDAACAPPWRGAAPGLSGCAMSARS